MVFLLELTSIEKSHSELFRKMVAQLNPGEKFIWSVSSNAGSRNSRSMDFKDISRNVSVKIFYQSIYDSLSTLNDLARSHSLAAFCAKFWVKQLWICNLYNAVNCACLQKIEIYPREYIWRGVVVDDSSYLEYTGSWVLIPWPSQLCLQ